MADGGMKRGATECPDLETIAAYLDGRLNERERASMAAHLVSCEACFFIFSEAAQPGPPDADEVARPRRWTRRRLLWCASGAAAAAAALVLAVGVSVLQGPTPEESGLELFVAAVGTDRTIEPRLTGGFAYGPVRGPVRAGEPAVDALPPDVRIAAARIEKGAIAERTPQNLRALGVSYLVMADPYRAVPILEEAADRAPGDARVLSDLAAAYLTRATREDTPQDLAKALAAADRAVKADRQMREGRFNRAFALERVSLADQAREAWQDYLEIDSTSGWADEARAHLATLAGTSLTDPLEDHARALETATARGDGADVARLVARSPDAVRGWLDDQILDVWPRDVLDGRSDEARGVLARAQLVADALSGATGDRFMTDAVGSAASASRAGRARAFAHAHQLFRAARVDYQSDRIASAMAQFERAGPPLERAGSPFGVWARLHLAIGRYYAADFRSALRAVVSVARLSATRDYLRVNGLAHRMWGLIQAVQGDFAGGLEQYRLAAAAFGRVRDVENDAAIRAAMAELLEFLGETDQAWSEISRSLAQVSSVRDRRVRHNILQRASLASLSIDLPESALYFQRAVLDNATKWERPLAIFDAHLYRSEIHRQIGDLDEALSDLQHARSALSVTEDRQLVERNEPRLLLTQGELDVQRHAPTAVDSLTAALAAFERAQRSWPIARVLLARGRAHASEGRVDLAEADFEAGIELFERRRASIADEALRSASFEQPWDLYTEMIRLQVISRRRPDRALAFAERARARTLLESLANGSDVPPADPASSAASLPPSVTVLYYSLLDDRLLVWVLTPRRQIFREVPVQQADVGHLLNQFKSEVAAQPTAGRDAVSLARLYDLLLRPVRESLETGTHVVVVPDGLLHRVPFAALVRSEDRRYLVEDHAIQVTPSLSVFLEATAQRAAYSARSTAFVVGNPAIGGDDARLAPDLPEAAAEASEVAALYRQPTLLLGPAATKEAFLQAAGRHDVIHFAGHAIANERHPQLSRLLLAGADGPARSLFARDIAGRRLKATRLVVLGACRTSEGRIRRGEGVFSLARPFIAAGVPAVVATLWDVNDRASRRLLVAFHRALRETGTAAEALRRAQLELMGDANPLLQSPAAWAGFTLIGGLTFGTADGSGHRM